MGGSRPTDYGDLDDVLEHFGIKGMKWGKRKSSPSTPMSEDKKMASLAESKVGKRGNTNALSNKELQTLVNRMNLEQQYSRLSTQNKKSNSGAKFVKEILLGVGKQQAIKVANDYASKQIAAQLTKK